MKRTVKQQAVIAAFVIQVITEQAIIPKLNHDWGEWSITEEPTFNKTGIAERICKNDNGHKDIVFLPALSDTNVWEESLRAEPTEIFDGYCSYISQYGTVSVTIPARSDKHYFIEYFDGTANVSSRDTGTYSVIFAAYDKSGVLTSIEIKPVTFETAGVKELNFETFIGDDAYTVKVMLWDSLMRMKPLAKTETQL